MFGCPSTDATGRSIANFVVGKLSTDTPAAPFLLYSKLLEKMNRETIAYFVNNSREVPYPSGTVENRVLLPYTDAASYVFRASTVT